MKHVALLLFSLMTISLQADEVKDLLRKVDELYRSDTSYSQMEMKVTTPDFERMVVMNAWTRGMDYTFIEMLSPRKDKGICTLKRKREMWNFFPKINKVIKVPPSMMLSSWMGSDFTNDDLVKENTLVDDYDGKILKKENEMMLIELIPKASAKALWGKIIIYVNYKKLIPIYQEYYDEKGEKIRTMTFKDVKNFSGKMIPAVMELVPHHKQGHKTVITYRDLKFNVKLKQDTFTRKNLQKRR